MTAQGATHRRAMAHAPSIRTFPHQQTEKAPRNHLVVSILHGGARRLQHRLPRISKPKTGCATTSLCRSSTVAPTAFNTDCHASANRKRAAQPPRCVDPPRWRPPPSTPTGTHQQTENGLRNHLVVSILHGGAHRLQHRLPRTSKPKMGCATTTLCPLISQQSGWHAAHGRPRATRRRRRGKAYRPESFTDEVSVERSMGRARHTIARSLCAHESFVGIIHVMSMVDVR